MITGKYDLHQLGWHSFQQLCIAVTTTVLGQTVESFLDGNDGGRDGAFKGSWSPQENEIYQGKFVIQCKFSARRGHNLNYSDISDELCKVKRLIDKGQCDIYVIMTNAGVTGASHLKITEAFEALGVKHALVLDSTWICQKIETHSSLRMNVPRLYGLGDLSQILDERRYNQTRALLSELQPDLAKTVVTDTYRKALQALRKHGFVLLVGEPAAGKTTIASLLAMCAMDEWKSQVLKLETPDQVRKHWNTEESSQFIWVDDAFGVTQYESHQVMGWNRTLDSVSAMIRRGHRIVMTSRDYIYNHAKRDLKRSTFPLFDESHVVIDVKQLTSEERQQILYNHVKLGDQPKHVRARLKRFLPDVAAHSRFVPETARRLGNSNFTKTLTINESSVNDFVAKQEQLLVETMRCMDADSHAALALIYMKEGAIESPVTLEAVEGSAIARLGSNEASCLRALEDLNGSYVQLVDTLDSRVWRYKHPTIGDAFALILAQSPEHLRIFVDGTSTERLMDLVSCGDVGVKNATIIPPSMFEEFIQRIYQYVSADPSSSKNYRKRGRLYSFLKNRSSRGFLASYLQVDHSLLAGIVEDFARSWFTSTADLALYLFREGLLPETARTSIVEKITNEVFESDELSYIYDREMHEFFTQGELNDFLEDIRKYVLPNLDGIRQGLGKV
ncbi:hypothetical protein SAMN05216198_1355 [Halopseudomonas litoralis]|uniref:Novel STAND NTPase 3 domain-containing protein n=1 Tax=Halopseudomonas litoralis TaxID=797277 RepID=A0A1H1Q1H5_9GAMM|nr:hypothetical protein [Halopseudomonas litoralis]SDS17332.1 hypothetical protein SAMN05216198_1355 [Halopseudomonas litoralis]